MTGAGEVNISLIIAQLFFILQPNEEQPYCSS
jgi:hypothetical protein